MNTLFEELRQRRVFQAAAIYVAVAWAATEILVFVIDALWPDQADTARRAVAIIFVAGFPAAMYLAWTRQLGSTMRRFVGAGALILVTAGILLWAQEGRPPPGEPIPVDVDLDSNAIAVLPFKDLGAEAESAAILASGIHDTLLTLLSRLGNVKVISRTTMDRYRDSDKSILEIGRELGVGNILEGGVQRVGDQIRVNVQLIEADSDEHVWAETYDRDLTAANLFQIQTEIAESIVGEMKIALTEAEQENLAKVPTKNTEALYAYMLGRERLINRNVPDMAEAIGHFAKARDLDPTYADAYVGLHDACQLHEAYSSGRIHEKCPGSGFELEPLLRKALELNSSLGEAYFSLATWHLEGDIHSATEEQLVEAEAAFDHGFALTPGYSQGYHWYASFLGRSGRGDAAVAATQKGLEIDPLSVMLNYMMFGWERGRQNYNEAKKIAERIVEIAPDSSRGYERLAELNFDHLGRMDEAIKWWRRAADIDPRNLDYFTGLGRAYTILGDYDTARAYYEKVTSADETGSRVGADLYLLLYVGNNNSVRSTAQQTLETELPDSNFRHVFDALVMLRDFDFRAAQTDRARDRFEKHFPSCFVEDVGLSDTEECWDNIQLLLILVFQALGDDQRAGQIIESSLASLRDEVDFPALGLNWLEIYNVEVHALTGYEDQALTALEDSVARGWVGAYEGWQYHKDFNPHLDFIRDRSRFQAAFAEVESKIAAQLTRVREMEASGEIATP